LTAPASILMSKRIILIGYGNPGRLDDGLGPALAARMETCAIEGLAVETDYQLVVEHAHDISGYDVAIFADAALNGNAPFSFVELHSSPNPPFNSHSLSPQTVLSLAKTMFNAKTKCYLLGIRGYEFDGFGERLSERAKENLELAFDFIRKTANNQSFAAN
jgi:hydrogenase maturation protease